MQQTPPPDRGTARKVVRMAGGDHEMGEGEESGTAVAAPITSAPPATDIFTGDEKSPEFWQWKSKMTGMCLMAWSGQSTAQKAGLIAARVAGSASNVLWGDLTGEETESPYTTPAEVFAALAPTYGKKSASDDAVIADLTRVRQDGKRATKYTEEFMAVATKGRLSDETRRGLYYGGLAKRVRTLMVGQRYDSLGEMIQAAHEIDELVDKPKATHTGQGAPRGRGGFRGRGGRGGRGGFGARGAQEQPMQAAGASSSGDQEWHTCWTCGGKGHRSTSCPQGTGNVTSGNTRGKARGASDPSEDGYRAPPMYDSEKSGAKRARAYTPSHSDFDIGDQ